VVDKYGDSANVPLFDRWYLGGIDSLRGYRYREVGPRYEAQGIRPQIPTGVPRSILIGSIPPNNEPHGGDTYWVGTAEYSVPIIDFVRLAAFYDIGMVYQDPYSFRVQTFGVPRGSNKLYNDNYGFGLRLNIPSSTATRFEPGDEREVQLVPYGGKRAVYGFNNLVDGPTAGQDAATVKSRAVAEAAKRGFRST